MRRSTGSSTALKGKSSGCTRICPGRGAVRPSFGHWEGDLMMFRKELGKHNLTSLVERQSRYTILTRNRDRNSTGVMTGMIEKLKVLPETARLSITFDRGTEFAYYPLLKQKLGMDSYFCKPQAPWQKGTVENTNGRVRRFLSRDANIAALPEEALLEICDRLNGTPRKCLGYRTPKEVLMSSLDPGLATDDPPTVALRLDSTKLTAFPTRFKWQNLFHHSLWPMVVLRTTKWVSSTYRMSRADWL
jgi:IS30 family transposase